VVAICGVINRVGYLQPHLHTTVLLPRSCVYLNSLGKFGFKLQN